MLLVDRGLVRESLSTGVLSLTVYAACSLGQRQLVVGNVGCGKTTLISNICINSTLNSYYDYFYKSFLYVFFNFIGSSKREYVYFKNFHRNLGKNFHYFVDSTVSLSLYDQISIPCNLSRVCLSLAINGVNSVHILDSLSNHAKLYRAFMLELGRSPGREAYPGDIFYLHSSLLERYCQLSFYHSGKSVTWLPVSSINSNNISDYITTNLISITDGQWFLSESLKRSGLFPSLDLNLSVSRIGSKTQELITKFISNRFKSIINSFLILEEKREVSTLSRFDLLRYSNLFNSYLLFYFKRGLSNVSMILFMVVSLVFKGFANCSLFGKGFYTFILQCFYGLNKVLSLLYWILKSNSFSNIVLVLNYFYYLLFK